MTEEDKAKIGNATEIGKSKVKVIWVKYMAICGKVYDFFAMIWRGQRKHTPETLTASQKRGTWIVTAFIVLAVIGAFMDDEEETDAEVVSETSSEEIYANNSGDDASSATSDGEYALKDVDVKIKSVCGFKFGATKGQCKQFLSDIKEGDEFANYTANNKEVSGRLKKPWRMFTKVKLVFTGIERVPPHLWKIYLESDDLNFSKISEDSCEEEVRKVKGLLEKKFGIKMTSSKFASGWYLWNCDFMGGCSKEGINKLVLHEGRIQLEVKCPYVIEIDEAIQKSQGKKINISEKEGLDSL